MIKYNPCDDCDYKCKNGIECKYQEGDKLLGTLWSHLQESSYTGETIIPSSIGDKIEQHFEGRESIPTVYDRFS